MYFSHPKKTPSLILTDQRLVIYYEKPFEPLQRTHSELIMTVNLLLGTIILY